MTNQNKATTRGIQRPREEGKRRALSPVVAVPLQSLLSTNIVKGAMLPAGSLTW